MTFAATASLLACGGSVDNGSTSDGGPDANPAGCPATMPSSGSACDGSMSCDYPGCDPSLTYTFACESGAWKQTRFASCNPPGYACPVSEPAIDSPCSSPIGCSYTDACVDRPSTSDGLDHLSCVEGKWSLATTYAPHCPALEPVEGTSCKCGLHAYTGTCTYTGSCSFGSGDASATCDPTTLTWRVAHSTCNPPAPDGGPIDVGTADAGETEVSPSDTGPGF